MTSSQGIESHFLHSGHGFIYYSLQIDKDIPKQTGVQAASIHELKIAGHIEFYSDSYGNISNLDIVKDSSRCKAVIIFDDITSSHSRETKKIIRQQTATD